VALKPFLVEQTHELDRSVLGKNIRFPAKALKKRRHRRAPAKLIVDDEYFLAVRRTQPLAPSGANKKAG